jgi:hypothetical protein
VKRTTSARRVAFATNAEFPECAPDDRTAISELAELGVEAVPAVWDDRSIDWSQFAAVVLRSTWGYERRWEEFLRWVDGVGGSAALWNPPDLVRWNAHKGYLLDLEKEGADIVPTELVREGSGRSFRSVLLDRGWTDAVVKPAVGANGVLLRIVRASELGAGEEHLRRLLHEGDALIQPLAHRVERVGERSLVFLDGEFSHAAEYPYVLAGGPREGTGIQVDAETRRAAERIVASLSEPPLYARADFLPAEPDGWWLSELELIEPYLHLRTDPAAPRRFAQAILRRLDRMDRYVGQRPD